MKLIDILVQELPKRGGWPGAIPVLVQHGSGYVYQAGGGECIYRLELADDWMDAEVTCGKYFDALRTLKPVWNGEGLPPVGIMCEAKYRSGKSEWSLFKCVASEQSVAFGWNGDEPVILLEDLYEFRPIRSEADKKRSDICDKIYGAMTTAEREGNRSDMAEAVYDAISAGKIPHIRID